MRVLTFLSFKTSQKLNSFEYKLERNLYPEGEPRVFFFAYSLIGLLLGEGGYKKKSKGIFFTKI